MSKKKRNQVRASSREESRSASPSLGSTRSAREEFTPDYTYVVKDLRRIGTLAGTFLVVLVVLSFFLR